MKPQTVFHGSLLVFGLSVAGRAVREYPGVAGVGYWLYAGGAAVVVVSAVVGLLRGDESGPDEFGPGVYAVVLGALGTLAGVLLGV